jgi:2-methylfumaryl-CoA isomerase
VELSLKDVAAAMLGHLGIIGEVEVNGVSAREIGQRALRRLRAGFRLRRRAAVMVIGLTDRQWRGC